MFLNETNYKYEYCEVISNSIDEQYKCIIVMNITISPDFCFYKTRNNNNGLPEIFKKY